MNRNALEWSVVAALPNVDLTTSVGGEIAAVASYDDPRVVDACSAQPCLSNFLGRFTDAFGEPIRPTVIIVHRDAPDSARTVSAIASLRDLVAISTVVHSRAFLLQGAHGPGVYFSDSFWLYPWMLDRSGRTLTARAPAIFGSGYDVAKFRGQCLPEIPVRRLSVSEIDRTLLDALLQRWRKSYSRRSLEDRLLFRSLNMANQAALAPAGTDATLFDYGRSVALWVSAFEILAHPGLGKSGLRPVYELFDSVEWQIPESARKRYKALPTRNERIGVRRTFACKLYGALYGARNDFLHGNKVAGKTLGVKGNERSLFHYAVPLYRMALTGFLQLILTKPVPPIDDPRVFAAHIGERMRFYDSQKVIEGALLTAREAKQRR